MDQPFLLMIAGPNGSGKTTLSQALQSKNISLGEYINPDDIAKDLVGSPDERTRNAQKLADTRRDECIKAKRSFTFETVMSHPSKIDILVRAKDAGYRVILYFIGTDDPRTNIERVALRVAQGGHPVPEEKIKQRWLRTMTLLQGAIRASDQSYIFDNSTAGTIDTVPKLVFKRNTVRDGHLPQSEMIGTPPKWVQEFVLDPLGANSFESYSTIRHKTVVGSIVTLPLQISAEPSPTAEVIEKEMTPKTSIGLSQLSKALWSAIDTAAHAYSQSGSGLRTGFRDLDRKIAGLQKSELIVLASRHGMGKTAFGTNIAHAVAKSWKGETKSDGSMSTISGGVVGFFSMEMSSEQIATRIISQQSGIPANTIRKGQITEKEFEVIRDLSIDLQNLPLFLDDTTVLSIDQLRTRAYRLKEVKGLDLLILDNLGLLRSAARNNFGATNRASLEITRKLKLLAKDLNIPVLILAQLPSKIERGRDRRPRLEEFDDNGLIEQDADLIMFLHRDDYYIMSEEPPFGSYEHENWIREVELVHGRAEIIIAKQRNGATGTVHLSFDPTIGSFYDLT